MKTNSRSKINITNQYVTDNCDCFCHYPEDMEMNEQHSILHQNLPSSSNTQAYRQTPLKKNTIPKKNSEKMIRKIEGLINKANLKVNQRIIINDIKSNKNNKKNKLNHKYFNSKLKIRLLSVLEKLKNIKHNAPMMIIFKN